MVDPKGFVAAGLGVLAVVAIFLGLFTNGWVSAEGESEWFGKLEINIGLRELEVSYGGITESVDLDDAEGEEGEDWDSAGLTVYIILWVTLLVCLGAIPCAILAGLHKMTKIPGMILGYVGGGLMILAAVLYIMIAPKKAYDVEDIGFGWTFYVVIIGGAVQAVGGDLVRTIKKRGYGPKPPGYPAPGLGTPERSPQRDDYYEEPGRRDHPPPQRDHYYDDRRSRDDPSHRRHDRHDDRRRSHHPPRRRDNYYDDRDGREEVSILKKRLARGEITKQEYEDLRRVIEE